MADIKARLSSARTKLFRRHSGVNSNSSSNTSPTSPKARTPFGSRNPEILRNKSSTSSLKSRSSRLTPRTPQNGILPSPLPVPKDKDRRDQIPYQAPLNNNTSTEAFAHSSEPNLLTPQVNHQEPPQEELDPPKTTTTSSSISETFAAATISPQPPKIRLPPKPPDAEPESLSTFMSDGDVSNSSTGAASDYRRSERKDSIVPPLPDFSSRPRPQTLARMSRRKIWIKRPGASATTVQSTDEDLVDDIRDMVLRKYGNSLGKCFDAPDVTIRIAPRERGHTAVERTLNPEEPIHSILDSYYPGGQTVEEALIIDVPQKRTPRPSPRAFNNYTVATAPQLYENHQQPPESGNDYFPPMAPSASVPPIGHEHRHSHSHSHSHSLPHPQPQSYHPHSISIVETGQLPPLPSPRERKGHHRPRPTRQHTSSPTIMASQGAAPNGMPTHRGSRSEWPGEVSSTKHASVRTPTISSSIPTPPPSDLPASVLKGTSTPPIVERVSSPRLTKSSKHKRQSSSANGESRRASGQEDRRKNSYPQSHLQLNLFESAVPPINVLIVEDNIINLRLLEMFTKRLKVRWQTAMNGRDAVTKWRAGGFHLVLMDIQLPIMSGLEATKEIRRLERVNGIGIFAKSEAEERAPSLKEGETLAENSTEDDKLPDSGLFKSPVIIVALTASSLQSDRHEALAAGCNDFLTKPVHFNWLERKVMEWGCMQALIDFDGWRKWKDIAAEEEKQKVKSMDPEAKAKAERKEAKKADLLANMGGGGGAQKKALKQ